MSKITILTLIDRIACFYSLKPFLDFDERRFHFTSSPEYCLEKDRNRTLIMVRRFIKPDFVDLELMKKLREKYDRIAFFHDDAGGGIPRLEVLPYVDLFYSKALFKDRSIYLRPLYGKELYSDYYHEKFGVSDSDYRERIPARNMDDLNKLRLSWNIGAGDYPRDKLRQRAGTATAHVLGVRTAKLFFSRKDAPKDPVAANTGELAVHARILLAGRPSIAYQRKLILDRIGSDPRFLTEGVSQQQYNREITQSKIVLSPFGWGELCVRDFEAVRAGAVLLKPDMSHLETWPDVFKPEETFVPFSWDADDLMEKTDMLLSSPDLMRTIAGNAWETYMNQMSNLRDRFESIITEISE